MFFSKIKKNAKNTLVLNCKSNRVRIAAVVSPRWSMVAVATTYHRREVREAVAVLLLAGIEEEREKEVWLEKGGGRRKEKEVVGARRRSL